MVDRINDRTQFVVYAERGHPTVTDDTVPTLVSKNLHTTVDLDTFLEEYAGMTVHEKAMESTQPSGGIAILASAPVRRYCCCYQRDLTWYF